MKYFPSNLHVDNKDNFPDINYNRTQSYLRRDLYTHIISHEEKDYFDLDKFRIEHGTNTETLSKMVEEVCKELTDIGWNTQLSYGGTGLFVYANEVPPNCFPDGFD